MAVNFTVYVKESPHTSRSRNSPDLTRYGNWRGRPHAAPG